MCILSKSSFHQNVSMCSQTSFDVSVDDDDGKVGIIHKNYKRQVWGNYHGKLASLGDPGPINMKCPYSGSIGRKKHSSEY